MSTGESGKQTAATAQDRLNTARAALRRVQEEKRAMGTNAEMRADFMEGLENTPEERKYVSNMIQTYRKDQAQAEEEAQAAVVAATAAVAAAGGGGGAGGGGSVDPSAPRGAVWGATLSREEARRAGLGGAGGDLAYRQHSPGSTFGGPPKKSPKKGDKKGGRRRRRTRRRRRRTRRTKRHRRTKRRRRRRRRRRK